MNGKAIKKKLIKIFSWMFLVLGFIGCGKSVTSYAMVGESKERVIEFMYSYEQRMRDDFNSDLTVVHNGDTLGIVVNSIDQPMELLYFFKNDTCNYQLINVYCSPCADKTVDQLLKDRRYRFKPLDSKNYRSTKQENILLRLSQNRSSEKECSMISIHRVDK